MASLELQEALRSLCHNTEWCFAVFWKLKHETLEFEQGFCKPRVTSSCASSSQTLPSDDRIEMAVDKMSYHLYPVGDGSVSQVASTNLHQWIFSSKGNEHPPEWHEQFAAGIKTIAVIAAHEGVVQLGSTAVITEDLNLVGHVKALLLKALQGIIKKRSTHMVMSAMEVELSQTTVEDVTTNRKPDISHVWSTLVARGRHLEDEPCSLSQSGSQSSLLQENTSSVSPPMNELQVTHHLSSLKSCTNLRQQNFRQPCQQTRFMQHSREFCSTVPLLSSQSSTVNGVASATVASERVESPFIMKDMACSILDVASPDTGISKQSIDTGVAHKSPRISLQSKSNIQTVVSSEAASDVGSKTQQSLGIPCNEISLQAQAQGMLVPNIANPLQRSSTSENGTLQFEERTSNSCSSSSTCCAQFSCLDVHTFDVFNSSDIGEHAPGGQSSSSLHSGDDVQHSFVTKPSSVDALQRVFSSELDEFDNFMASFPREQDLPSNEMAYLPFNQVHVREDASKTLKRSSCTPSFWDHECLQHTLNKHATTEKLKEDVSTSCHTFETDIIQMGRPGDIGEINNLHVTRTEGTSINTGLALRNSEHKNCPQEFQKLQMGPFPRAGGDFPMKAGKKRTRQGEKTVRRAKDRQLIQDRLHELRSIIPSSGKCSIDALLEKTIKYVGFLQTVTEEAGIWNDYGKMQAGEESHSSNGRKGGVSWAMEIGGHGRDCPLFVEDLKEPQHVLVEMLCEEEGLFLEIANTLRGLGLRILKGHMESRDEKMWARFVVQGNEHVHRVHIMWSLMHLLEVSATAASTVTDACGRSTAMVT
ncbi:hypothetical protein L7F22_048632 [Adiantum nelumboides]|nr:hypothetical protein [Adiantum nelumboides]